MTKRFFLVVPASETGLITIGDGEEPVGAIPGILDQPALERSFTRTASSIDAAREAAEELSQALGGVTMLVFAPVEAYGPKDVPEVIRKVYNQAGELILGD